MTTKIKMSSLLFACASCFSGNLSGCFLFLLDRIMWLQITSNRKRTASPSADTVPADKPGKDEMQRKNHGKHTHACTQTHIHIIFLAISAVMMLGDRFKAFKMKSSF